MAWLRGTILWCDSWIAPYLRVRVRVRVKVKVRVRLRLRLSLRVRVRYIGVVDESGKLGLGLDWEYRLVICVVEE